MKKTCITNAYKCKVFSPINNFLKVYYFICRKTVFYSKPEFIQEVYDHISTYFFRKIKNDRSFIADKFIGRPKTQIR